VSNQVRALSSPIFISRVLVLALSLTLSALTFDDVRPLYASPQRSHFSHSSIPSGLLSLPPQSRMTSPPLAVEAPLYGVEIANSDSQHGLRK